MDLSIWHGILDLLFAVDPIIDHSNVSSIFKKRFLEWIQYQKALFHLVRQQPVQDSYPEAIGKSFLLIFFDLLSGVI